MWKVFVGFIAFALIALFVVMKGGDKIDMQGESGQGAAEHASAPAPVASAPAPVASMPAPVAASEPAAAPASASK